MEERGEGQKWRNGDENKEEGLGNWSEGCICEMTKRKDHPIMHQMQRNKQQEPPRKVVRNSES